MITQEEESERIQEVKERLSELDDIEIMESIMVLSSQAWRQMLILWTLNNDRRI